MMKLDEIISTLERLRKVQGNQLIDFEMLVIELEAFIPCDSDELYECFENSIDNCY